MMPASLLERGPPAAVQSGRATHHRNHRSIASGRACSPPASSKRRAHCTSTPTVRRIALRPGRRIHPGRRGIRGDIVGPDGVIDRKHPRLRVFRNQERMDALRAAMGDILAFFNGMIDG